MPWDENELLRGLLSFNASHSIQGPIPVDIGDDSAVVRWASPQLVACSDLMAEGVHFDLKYCLATDVGYKSVTTNLSDIAAMGAQPLYILCAIAAPSSFDMHALFEGIKEACNEYHVSLVGGDLSLAPQAVITVTALGHPLEGYGVLTRAGAQVGDSIYLTRPLGRSAAGLRSLTATSRRPLILTETQSVHLRPTPRIREGQCAIRAGANSAIDISDGLALDLHRLSEASKVGFTLDHVPHDSSTSEEDALYGGEDYELLITTGDGKALLREFSRENVTPPILIGQIIADERVKTFRAEDLPRRGYLHS